VLEEPPGNLPLDHEIVKKARGRLFGSWEMNWMAYNYAHDVALTGSSGAPVGFFMYPQAETADGRLDCLDPDGFKYEITSREITSAKADRNNGPDERDVVKDGRPPSHGSYRHNRREHSKSSRCMYVMVEGPSVNFDLLVAFGDQPSINFAGVVIGCFRFGELRL